MTAPQRERKQIRENLGQTPSFYSNDTLLAVSPYDFTFHFGLLKESTGELLHVAELVTVTMSPQHAQRLSDVLVRQLEEYEKRVGSIPRIPQEQESEQQTIGRLP